MKSSMKKRWIKKGCLLAFLAVAGVLIGEVVGYLTRPSAVDILQSLKAELVMEQSLYVNGRVLSAQVWQLPHIASDDPLRKAADKLLVVGKTVYVFQDDFGQSKGLCEYPSDLPYCDIACDYVIETGNARVVIGTTTRDGKTLASELNSTAQAAGWVSQLPADGAFYWVKDGKLLMIKVKEFPGEQPTQVALVEQRIQS